MIKKNPPSNFILPETPRGKMLRSLATDNPKLTYRGVELGGAAPGTYRTLLKLLKDKQKEYNGEEIRLYYLFGADEAAKDHAAEYDVPTNELQLSKAPRKIFSALVFCHTFVTLSMIQ